MKNILFLLFIFSTFCSISAQTIIVTYRENRINLTPSIVNKLPSISLGSSRFENNPNKDLVTYTLTYSNGASYYENNDFSKLLNKRFMTTDTIKDSTSDIKINHFMEVYDNNKLRSLQRKMYKNFEKEEAQAVFYFDGINQYNVKDKLFKHNYTVTNETKNVLGYLCKKAIFNDGAYAWFAVDLPIPAGPDTLHGLPGLILEYQGKYNEWVATNVQVKKASTTINDLGFTGTVYTNEEFVKKQQEDAKIKPATFFNNKKKLEEVKRYQFN